MSEAKKAKVVLFYKNGDRNFRGYHVSITQRRFKNFDNLLAELTRVTNLPQGARFIFTPDTGEVIQSLDELVDGKSYVCSSHHKFKKISYGAAPDGSERKLKPKSFIPSHAQSPMQVHDVTATRQNLNIKPKIITVIRNALAGRRQAVKILLNKRTAQTYEQVLNDITSSVGVSAASGVRKLFTTDGKLVMSLSEMFSEGNVFIAVGSEKFYPDEIDDMLAEHNLSSSTGKTTALTDKGHNTDEKKSSTKKKKGGFIKDSLRTINRRRSVDHSAASSVPPSHRDSLNKHKLLPALRKMSASSGNLTISDANNNAKNTVRSTGTESTPQNVGGVEALTFTPRINGDHVTFDVSETYRIDHDTDLVQNGTRDDFSPANRLPSIDSKASTKTPAETATPVLTPRSVESVSDKSSNKLSTNSSDARTESPVSTRPPPDSQVSSSRPNSRKSCSRRGSRQSISPLDRPRSVSQPQPTTGSPDVDIKSGEVATVEETPRSDSRLSQKSQLSGSRPNSGKSISRPGSRQSTSPLEVVVTKSPEVAPVEETQRSDSRSSQKSQPRSANSRDSGTSSSSSSKIPVAKPPTITSSADNLDDASITESFSKLGDHRKEIESNSEISQYFDIGRKLGDGNFAVVKVATDKSTKEEFALKIIDRSKIAGKEDMLNSEISIQRDCSHPNICSLYEDIHSPSEIFLVMELVTGGDYFDLVANNIKFEEDEAAYYIRDLCSALDYLHKRRIVHRDIKPENLMVVNLPTGKKMLKLADFGLAMKVTAPIFSVCGTPTYVAPEILTEEGYGLEVDVWAAGVIMYISLCGFPPFRSAARSQTELFDIIESGEFEFLAPYWEDASAEAKDLIENILVVDRKKRFTCVQIMQHPWMKKHGLTRTNTLDDFSPRRSAVKKSRRASARFRTAIITVQSVQRLKLIKDLKIDRGERFITPSTLNDSRSTSSKNSRTKLTDDP